MARIRQALADVYGDAGAVAPSRGPGEALGRREPAADGLSGDREDASGQEDRRGALGAWGHGAHHHQDPCGRAERNVGLGAQTADHWVQRNVRNGHCSATWLVIEELTQLDTPLWLT